MACELAKLLPCGSVPDLDHMVIGPNNQIVIVAGKIERQVNLSICFRIYARGGCQSEWIQEVDVTVTAAGGSKRIIIILGNLVDLAFVEF